MPPCLPEKVVGIETGEVVERIDMPHLRICEGVAVYHGSCGIGGTVAAVGAGTEEGDLLPTRYLRGQPEGQVLVASSQPAAGDFEGGLTTEKKAACFLVILR